MKKTLMTQVMISIFEVMETMFFYTTEEHKEENVDFGKIFDLQSAKGCQITFSGKESGLIYLLVPLSILQTITSNFLGQNIDSLTDEDLDGTLKEALNMIAGSALTKVDEKSYMGLGIPEMIDASKIKINDDAVAIDTSDGSMAFMVEMDS